VPGPERVAIPALTSRSGAIWLTGTLVLVVGLLGYVAVTQPQHRWAVAVVALLLVLAGLTLASPATWVEPATGAVVREILRCRRRRVALRSATSVALVDNRAGSLLLAVTDGRTVYLPVLALTDYVQRSQSPEILRLLAELIDRDAPATSRVAPQLRGQADFVASGGSPERSPLAGLVTHDVLRAAKAGGAGGLLG
jgi:hypothetical protein